MAKVYAVTLRSVKGTIVCSNTVHYVVRVGPGGSSDAQDLLTLFLSKVQAKYAAVLGSDSVLNHAAATEEVFPPGSAIPDHDERVLNVTGTRLGIDTFNSPALCGIIKFGTNAAVKGAHGHIFLPPASSSSDLGAGAIWKNTGNYWLAGTALATELLNGIHSGSWWTGGWDANLVVYSRHRRATAQPNYYFDVISAAMDPAQRWLRSRTS